MKELTFSNPSNGYRDSLDSLLYRSQLHLHCATGELHKTQAGQRALQRFLHLCIEQSKELTTNEWKALATMCLAAAHNADEPQF